MNVLKFSKRKFSGLDGITYLELAQENAGHDKPIIFLCSKAGVTIKGQIHLSDMNELQDFAEVLSDAWAEAFKLTPKLMRDLPSRLV